MTQDPHRKFTDDIDPETVKPLIREGLIISGLLGVMLLGVLLPGTARELPGTAVTIGGLVTALGTLGIVVSVFVGAPTLREAIQSLLDGPDAVVRAAGRIGQYLGVFLGVVLAYQGFAPVLRPLLAIQWVYDLAFLLLAFLPLGLIAFHFYRVLDPLVEFILTALVDEREAQSPASSMTGENQA